MKPNILLIDDDAHVVDMLVMGLKPEFEVVPVSQPEKALQVFQSADFDLVISDIKMPELSGFEILRAVKTANPLIEVILLTGELPDKAKPAVSALKRGAYDYLIKPVKIQDLKSAIHKALAQQRRNLEDKRNLQELIRLANTDTLTGLSNRRHFESQLKLEFERSYRYQRYLSCLILDIDEFSKINDAYGHRYGDLVLQRVGSLISSHLRSSDFKCRYGGEEFVLALPEANETAALAAGEKLRSIFAKESFCFEDTPLHLTACLGLATYWKRNFESAEEMIHAADLALMRAKRDGRNCVRIHPSEVLIKSPNPLFSEMSRIPAEVSSNIPGEVSAELGN